MKTSTVFHWLDIKYFRDVILEIFNICSGLFTSFRLLKTGTSRRDSRWKIRSGWVSFLADYNNNNILFCFVVVYICYLWLNVAFRLLNDVFRSAKLFIILLWGCYCWYVIIIMMIIIIIKIIIIIINNNNSNNNNKQINNNNNTIIINYI